MSYATYFKLLEADGKPVGTAEVVFSEKSAADKLWSALQNNPTALGAAVKKEDLARPRDTWFTVKGATSDALFDLPNQKGFEELGAQFGIIRYLAQKTAAAPAAAAPEDGEVTLSSLAEQISKLSEQVAAGGGGAAAPGKDQGANWQNGPNWKGGHESFMLVDKAYKTCLQKKDEGDDRGFSMIFSQEMMELRRRQRG